MLMSILHAYMVVALTASIGVLIIAVIRFCRS